MAKSSGKYRFRHDDRIGAADAEHDKVYLDECYVDTGDVATLLDCDDERCIVLGRTGSGKTALLLELEKRAAGRTKRLLPSSLALNHISNSDTIRVLSEMGVSLAPFFKLLWRHVLTIEILHHIRPITEADKKSGMFEWVMKVIRNDRSTEQKRVRHRKVVQYMEKHCSAPFWAEVGDRVVQIVSHFEAQIKETIGGELLGGVHVPSLEASSSVSASSDEQKRVAHTISSERRARFQRVVQDINAGELDGIMELAAEVLEDSGQDVYLVIDQLDLQWSDEDVRYKLIRALIDVAMSFARVSRVKVVLALRVDLIERAYRHAGREPGVQMEKVRDLCIPLAWSRSMLLKLMDERVSKLYRDKYAPNYQVSHKDIIHPKIKKGRFKQSATIDFILERTWGRPRDVLEFFNCAIARSAGKDKITEEALFAAEGEYSRHRLQSMQEEWQLEYPYLADTLGVVLRGIPTRFSVRDMTDDILLDWVIQMRSKPVVDGDRLRSVVEGINDHIMNCDDARLEIATVLYKTGAVGVQNNDDERPQWASNLSYTLSRYELNQNTHLYLHPGLWKAFGK